MAPATTLACPACSATIGLADVNVAKDTALCRACGNSMSYADLVHTPGYDDVDPNDPPAGCASSMEIDGVSLSASHRSLKAALGLLLVSLFWNGIVSVFMVVAYGSLLHQLGLVPGSWLPPMNGQPMGWGMTIFLLLFLIPFELIGGAMLVALGMSVLGRTTVRLGYAEGSVRSAIGPLGRTKRFQIADVTNVTERTKTRRDSDGDVTRTTHIVIQADRELKFGAGLPEKRRHWLAGAIRASVMGAKA